MRDYWTELKLNECWSTRQRYNRIMNIVLNTVEGESDEPMEEEEEDLNPVGAETPPAMEEEEED